MAQVTVSQLAETVGASAERLLAQMKDAGLPHASAEEAVSEEDKQTLLAFLKKSHGEGSGAPKKSPSSASLSVRYERAVPASVRLTLKCVKSGLTSSAMKRQS